MDVSVFDLFSIGIGPSSSHTVGPMRASRQFILNVDKQGLLSQVASIKIDLYGSLALTGKGHATDLAILLGSEGETPEGIDPNVISDRIQTIRHSHKLHLLGKHPVTFVEQSQLIFHYDKQLPYHPNAMRFTVFDSNQKELKTEVYYSLGGGFIIDHEKAMQKKQATLGPHFVPFHFSTGEELLNHCKQQQKTIAEIMMANELTMRSEDEIRSGLLNIWQVMQECIERGYHQEGVLPGGLNVQRRAAGMYRTLKALENSQDVHHTAVMEWVSLWALAVNEENAAGGRVVTAPTNGAAGIIPAVMKYYEKFGKDANEEGILKFMLTAGAIGILYKEGASISAAEMGCMGEVGVACSMAAAGLTAALGGSSEQIENAAEIGMEHNLGLTCDPVMGLVQIPCIERNTMGAIKAINAMLLAMHGDGQHRVSLDQVIAAMKHTGEDMKHHYKETSLGGLAVYVPKC